MVTFSELSKEADKFCTQYVKDQTPATFRADLLALMQKAVEYGEQKDQSKIGGILTTVVKSFMGK
jgi:hypothetical protein